MKIFVKSIGEVTLDETKDFIASGGEGKIYAKGSTVYKIYDDIKKMIPVAKINELSVLDHPNIIKPELLILDSKQKIIGHTMKYVKNSMALCRMFTKSFKQANQISPEITIDLTQNFQKLVKFIHNKKILVVDLNELNFLVSNNDVKNIFAIDVNSYQTPSFPATAIMPNIKDIHCNNQFTEETDWFSWGIIACQIILGIHPYKHGGYQPFENLPMDQRMEARMKANISIFNPKVKIPAVSQPLDIIPSALKSWFIDVFEKGKRIVPPDDYVLAIQIANVIKTITGSNLFEIKELKEIKDNINKMFYYEGIETILSNKNTIINDKEIGLNKVNIHVSFTSKYNKPILGWIENDVIQLFDATNMQSLQLSVQANYIFSCNNRIYIRNDTGILEIVFKEINNEIIPATKLVGRVTNSTVVLDGFVIQSVLGRYIASIFPETGICHQINIKELDGYKIIDGRYENKILIIIATIKGKYSRFIFRLSDDFQSYDYRKVESIAYTDLNFTVNDAGICVLISEDEKIELFSNKMNSSIKCINDPVIDGDMKLSHNGGKILFSKNNKIYSISMKKNI